MRFVSLIVLLVSVAACEPAIPSGQLRCAADPARPCPSGFVCIEGACWRDGEAPGDLAGADEGAPLPGELGAACASGAACDSGHCVDGVCCDSACDDGACRSCGEPGSRGQCVVVVGSPRGARACAGDADGACRGICAGESASCVYALAGTSCGAACDGACDGAGVCSSTGTCSGGYGCGSGKACLAACQGSTDCVPGHGCDLSTGTCVAGMERDCLDGLDDNGDGLADCEDPSCAPVVECVPEPSIGGVHGYLAEGSTSCGSTVLFEAGSVVHQGLQNTGCANCACAGTLRCTYNTSFYRNSTICADDGTGTNSTVADIEMRFPGTCIAQTPSANAVGTGYVLNSVRFDSVKDRVATCSTSASSAQKQAISWTTDAAYCPVKRSSMTCGSPGSVCVPRAPPAASQCVRYPGAGQTCPSGFEVDRGSWSSGALVDTRVCGCGACSTAGLRACDDPALIWSAPVEFSPSTSCSGAGITAFTATQNPLLAGCASVSVPGSTQWPTDLRSVDTSGGSPGTCVTPGTLTSGAVTSANDVTVCCR